MSQNMNLSMTPYTQAGAFVCSQYDVGRECQITLVDDSGNYTIPTGATITVMATKPSGLGFSVACTWTGSTVTFSTTDTMTNEFGRFPAELRITQGDTILGTTNFYFKVEKSPHPNDVIDDDVIIRQNLVTRVTTLEGQMATVQSDISDVKADISESGIKEQVSYDTLVGAIRASDGAVIGDALPIAHSSIIKLQKGDTITVTAYTYSQFAILAEYVDDEYTSLIEATTNGVKTTSYTAPRDMDVSFTMWSNNPNSATITRSIITTNETLNQFEGKIGFVVDDLRNGTIENLTNAVAVSMINIRPTNGAYGARVFIKRTPETGTQYMARYTTFSVSEGNARNNMSSQIKYNYDSEKGTSFVDIMFDSNDIGFSFFLLQPDSSGNFVALRVDDFEANDIFVCYLYKDSAKFINYCIGSDFCKKPITLEYQGTLSGWQSFCMYDSNIYSATSDGYIIKQNSSYTQLSVKQADIGHGNAFQLGSNGKAYISGWDDNKVHVIDLASMEVESTITLPTTGYTGCAVDDINHLVYVFQIDTSPNTEDYYNFIVYDYSNQQVISTKKTYVSFGAMQACDFIDGKIFVLNGLGNTTIPNGYRIYNTNGDVIGEYVIGSYDTLEPEGIFVNRNTKDVYISYGNGHVYKIT